jgi:predicted dehydrogenase
VKVLVIGYGSVGRRHARLLTEMGCDVAVVSRGASEFPHHYFDLQNALSDWKPAYVVVANRTSEHHHTLALLGIHGFQGRVLVEKPLFDRPLAFPQQAFSMQVVGYNLRCHPLLLRLQRFLTGQAHLVAASLYVGQYLPQWRPESDYRESYSARRQEGGGALRDLSHELDCILWLFGPWHRLTAIGGKFSTLEIDSDDAYSLLMHTERCPAVSVQLNYVDRAPRRQILVHTAEHSVRVDLVGGVFEVDGVQDETEIGRDATYRAEHEAMLAGDSAGLCSFAEAMETLMTIEAAERAAATHTWVER